jgi:Winged helix DNA-binding domain
VRLSANGIRTEGQATFHLLMFAALRGTSVLGPLKGGGQAFVLTEDWLGARPLVQLEGRDRDAALAELARRYLIGHGPARPEDLATWAGVPLRDARAGFKSIAHDLVDDSDVVEIAKRTQASSPPPPNLLPAFDPYLLGWKDRNFAVTEAHRKRVHPGGGILRPVVLVDGAAAGTWSARRRGGALTIGIDSFGRLTDGVANALHQQALDVARFEGLSLNG